MENEFFLRRLDQMAEGDSSYRTENYMRILEAWFSSESFINLIFGFGFASSLEITGRHFAHNDWLELLSNFGLIGVLLYLFLIGSTYKYLKDKKYSFENRLMLLSIVIIWFLMTMFSMWYTALFTFLQAVLLGYIYGEQARLTKIYKPK
jgi:O-antigen ligase